MDKKTAICIASGPSLLPQDVNLIKDCTIIAVRVDEEGCYNLNDLHAAAVIKGKATESQRPGEFLKSKQIKRFAQSLTEAKMVASVKTVKGGNNQG